MEGSRDQRQEGAGQGGASSLHGASGIWHLAPLRSIPLHQNGGRTRNQRLQSSEYARWRQSGVAPVLTAVSYMAWLNDDARRWPWSASRHWEPPLPKAFRAAAERRTGNWY